MRTAFRRIALFYGATFALTHAASLAYVWQGGAWNRPGSYIVANLLMLCPGVVAIAVHRRTSAEPAMQFFALRFRPNPWFLASWLVPTAVALAALGVSLLLPGAEYAPDMGGLGPEMASFRRSVAALGVPPLAAMVVLGLVLGPTATFVGGLGEELGWRGFLYRELASLGFWRCSLVTAGLWVLWHVPLFLEGYGDPEHPVLAALGMVAFLVCLAPVLHLVRARSGSVVACGILHGTFSSSRLTPTAFVRGAGPLADFAIPAVLVGLMAAFAGLSTSRRKGGESRVA